MQDEAWARFGISEDERLDHERFIAASSRSLVSGLPASATVLEDVRQEMWVRCLALTGGPDAWRELTAGTGDPPVLPVEPGRRRSYIRKAMWRAGCDCLARQVYDGPRCRGSRRNDWSRMAGLEEVHS